MFRQDIPEIKDFKIGGKCKYGTDACAIESVFAIVEQERPLHFSINLVKELVRSMKTRGAIDKEFTIQWIPGWENCFYICGLLVDARYVNDPAYICKKNEREVLKLVKREHWSLKDPPAHYVPGNGRGEYSWDSLGHRPQQRDYAVFAKRIFTIKGVV